MVSLPSISLPVCFCLIAASPIFAGKSPSPPRSSSCRGVGRALALSHDTAGTSGCVCRNSGAKAEAGVRLSAQPEPEGCEVWGCGGRLTTTRRVLVCKWSRGRENLGRETETETGDRLDAVIVHEPQIKSSPEVSDFWAFQSHEAISCSFYFLITLGWLLPKLCHWKTPKHDRKAFTMNRPTSQILLPRTSYQMLTPASPYSI